MKITFRVWILAISLALAAITIINGSSFYRILAGVIILLIPFVLTRVDSRAGKIIAIIILTLSFVYVVYASAETGVVVSSVGKNSTAFNEGLRQGMVITSINSEVIEDVNSYIKVMGETLPSAEEKKIVITTKDGEIILLTNKTLNITVEDTKPTTIKTGLDLSGGARALIRPDKELNSNEMSDLIAITSNRLNVFGLSDITVRGVTDLEGVNFMLVEVAGVTPTDLEELVAKQGKFEARIGNGTVGGSSVIFSNSSGTNISEETISGLEVNVSERGKLVFRGGEGDISDVCRNRAECSGVIGCSDNQGEFICNFRFTIFLTPDAAETHASVTQEIPLDDSGQYLTERLYLYVDDAEVDSLLIGSDLRGQVTTQISIQGSGVGLTEDEANDDARASMKKLQTILITGSLPYKLHLEKLDSISPSLGREFTKNIIFLAVIVFVVICALLFIRYRRLKITLAVILTVLSEATLTLAVAALIRWNLDAPSIAGIIAGMGVGINDQIIILDESISKEDAGLGERIRRALFIILGAFFTIVAAMLPLFWAGTGLLRGFALTTIIGVTVGILITRPAFADIIKRISE